MKRTFLMSALVLALASSAVACGGGAGGTDQPAKDGDAPKKDETSNDDPVVELQNISDGLQKAVDEVFQPIKDADALLESIGNLPKDLKALKSKVDSKKLMAEIKKILTGGDPALDGLKLEDDAKAKVQERIDKLKALMASIQNMDVAVKDLGSKIADTVVKVPAVGGKAIAKLEVTLKNPFGSGDVKKKAEEDKAKIGAIVDGFKGKVAEWQKLITDIPAKAKELPGKFAKAFK
jgi:hypothetical protein